MSKIDLNSNVKLTLTLTYILFRYIYIYIYTYIYESCKQSATYKLGMNLKITFHFNSFNIIDTLLLTW